MDTQTELDNLKAISEHLRKAPQVEAVYLEYPGYLAVVFNEEKELIAFLGYSLDSEQLPRHLAMTWNDPYGNGGEFDTKVRHEANAEELLKQVAESGMLDLLQKESN
jgi:hypothetical protein